MKYRRRLARKLRQIKGRQSQANFAYRIGIKQSSLNRILKAKQPLNLDMLERICTFLGKDISELMKPDRDDGAEQPVSDPSIASCKELSCCSSKESQEEDPNCDSSDYGKDAFFS